MPCPRALLPLPTYSHRICVPIHWAKMATTAPPWLFIFSVLKSISLFEGRRIFVSLRWSHWVAIYSREIYGWVRDSKPHVVILHAFPQIHFTWLRALETLGGFDAIVCYLCLVFKHCHTKKKHSLSNFRRGGGGRLLRLLNPPLNGFTWRYDRSISE